MGGLWHGDGIATGRGRCSSNLETAITVELEGGVGDVPVPSLPPLLIRLRPVGFFRLTLFPLTVCGNSVPSKNRTDLWLLLLPLLILRAGLMGSRENDEAVLDGSSQEPPDGDEDTSEPTRSGTDDDEEEEEEEEE
jgi:hypothetical protein